MLRRSPGVLVAALAALIAAAPGTASAADRLSVGLQAGLTLPLAPGGGLPPAALLPLYRVSLALDPPRPRAGVPGTASVTVLAADGLPFPAAADADAVFTLVGLSLEEFVTVEDPAYQEAAEGSLRGARFSFPLTFPSGGRYCLITEFSDRGSRVARLLDIPVEGPRQPVTRWNFSRIREVGGLRAVLRADPPRSLTDSPLLFDVELTSGGSPVADLQPIHGAWAEVLLFREGLGSWALIPGDTRRNLDDIASGRPASPGPRIWFRHRFPTDDRYRLWIKVRRAGKTLVFPFDLWVEPEFEFDRRDD